MSEESKTSEEEPKTVTLPDFLNKSFECLFNQNVHLHRGLAQVLQEEFKKQEERQAQLEEKIDVLEKNLKEGFFALYQGNYKRIRCYNTSVIGYHCTTFTPNTTTTISKKIFTS